VMDFICNNLGTLAFEWFFLLLNCQKLTIVMGSWRC
jgi:hypothetical protein